MRNDIHELKPKAAMKQIGNLLALIAFSCAAATCGFLNPDPADQLGHLIERETRKLKSSGDVSTVVDFVPGTATAGKSPRFTGDVVARVAPGSSAGTLTHPAIVVSEWVRTTYHNRFVSTPSVVMGIKMDTCRHQTSGPLCENLLSSDLKGRDEIARGKGAERPQPREAAIAWMAH